MFTVFGFNLVIHFFLGLLLIPATVRASEVERVEIKPLLEAGLSAFTLYTPHYPGAEQGRQRYLLLPYAFYRGEIFRSDEDGALRGRFIDNPKIEVDVSIGASFPADSSDNDARDGMPDLDFISEFGPQVIFHMVRTKTYGELDFSLPVRWVFSTDLSRLDDRGFVTDPSLRWEYKNFDLKDLILYVRLGSVFATRQLMTYFYQVDDRYVRADRPYYRAEPGYLATQFSTAFSYSWNRDYWLFTAISWDFLDGNRNEDSPLFKEDINFNWVIGLAWKLYESDAREESHF